MLKSVNISLKLESYFCSLYIVPYIYERVSWNKDGKDMN